MLAGLPEPGDYSVHVKPLRYQRPPAPRGLDGLRGPLHHVAGAGALLPLRRDRSLRREAEDQRQGDSPSLHLAHRGDDVPYARRGAAILLLPRMDALVVAGGPRDRVGGRDHMRSLRPPQLPAAIGDGGRRAPLLEAALGTVLTDERVVGCLDEVRFPHPRHAPAVAVVAGEEHAEVGVLARIVPVHQYSARPLGSGHLRPLRWVRAPRHDRSRHPPGHPAGA